ncbi:MAG TPA: RNA-binding protein [Candidatus Eisenbacteria bacterium]|nr:RNA-binding protein [Candidatus Eisenbacteria bacterium]
MSLTKGERVISATIFVGNLSYESTEEELRALFAEVDPGVRVRLGIDRMTGKARGFAFAQFASDAQAADAVRRFDGLEMRGRRLRVNDADDKPPPRAPRPAARPETGGGFSRAPVEFVPPPEDGGGDFRGFRKGGGSRRGLRARKRSLRY